ncbi:MAG: hypothetical protein FWC27_13545 [Firmicutes bacterium]|nr:hypothetical protein [Bacillota bacterium]
MSGYNPQEYSQPPPPAPENKTKAVAALVIGIAALAASWAIGWIPFVSLLPLAVAIVGIVVSVGARKQSNSGLATGGMVCSIIALVFSGAFFLSCTLCSVCTAGAAGLGALR